MPRKAGQCRLESEWRPSKFAAARSRLAGAARHGLWLISARKKYRAARPFAFNNYLPSTSGGIVLKPLPTTHSLSRSSRRPFHASPHRSSYTQSNFSLPCSHRFGDALHLCLELSVPRL